MKRIHVLGLPRSGTTALSEAVARELGLPLAVEPIFLWTDGFRVDLSSADALDASQCQRIRDNIATLSKLYQSHGGFVEKTPSSVFFASFFGEIVTDSIVILIERDRGNIVRSLENKVLEGRDGNVASDSSLRLHNLKVRAIKVALLIRTLGPIEASAALVRFLGWSRRNSIGTLADAGEIRSFVDTATAQLERLNTGSSNRLIVIPYERFRTEPNVVLDEILMQCETYGQKGVDCDASDGPRTTEKG